MALSDQENLPAAPSTTARRDALAIAAIVLLAAAFRLFRLGEQSFWVDEINVLSFVRSGHLLTALRERGGPFELPLHYVAVWAASFLPLGFETSARVPAAVFGTLEVLALMLVARRLTARIDVALLAGSFLAFAPFAIRYSQENRYYTTFSALALLSWWLVLRAVERRTTGAFLWWGLGVGALVLAHPFAPLVVVAELVAIAVLGRRGAEEERRPTVWRKVVGGLLLAGAVAGPWIVWGLFRWIPDARAGRSYQLNAESLGPVRLDVDLLKRTAEWLLANGGRWTLLSALLALLAAVSVVAARGRLRVVAVWVWIYVAVFVLALVPLARVLNTYLAMRRIEFLVPELVLLAAIGIVGIGDRIERTTPAGAQWWRRLSVGAVLLLSAVAIGTYYTTEKTDYRQLAAVVGATSPGDTVVIGPIDERWEASIRDYLHWRGVDREVTYVVVSHARPKITVPPGGKVLWLTGASPDSEAFHTRALNSVPDLQVIAGDRTSPGAILPWFASTTRPRDEQDLRDELDRIVGLPALLPPPSSHLPWFLLTGR